LASVALNSYVPHAYDITKSLPLFCVLHGAPKPMEVPKSVQENSTIPFQPGYYGRLAVFPVVID